MRQKRKARSPRGCCRAEQTAFQKSSIKLWSYDQKRENQCKENNAQDNGNPEQRSLNTTAGGIYASRIGPGETTQPCTLALQNYTKNEQDRDYNQRDIQIVNHLIKASF